MYRKAELLSLLLFFMVSVSLIISSYLIYLFLLNFFTNGYEYYFIHPLLFSALTMLFMYLLYNNIDYFDFGFIFILFSRYTVLPFMTVMSENFGGRSHVEPSLFNYHKAILLMSYELIVVFLLYTFVRKMQLKATRVKKSRILTNKRKYKYNVSPYFAILFLFFSLIVVLLRPNIKYNFNFIKNRSIIFGGKETSWEIFLIILISKFKEFFLVALMVWNIHRNRYNISILCFILNISLYSGDSRISLLNTAISSIVLLILLKKVDRKIFVLMLSFFLFVFISLTKARNYVTINEGFIFEIQDTLQTYLGGVYNVAISIETKEWFGEYSNMKNLLFDFFRSFFGLNVLAKSMNMLYSNQYFNFRMWTHVDRRTQIMPMIGQGYFYFGSFFSIILSAINVLVLLKIRKNIKETDALNHPISLYILILLYLRNIVFMGQNIMNITSYFSTYIILYIIFYSLNRVFKNLFRSNIIVKD